MFLRSPEFSGRAKAKSSRGGAEHLKASMEPVRHFIAEDGFASDERIDLATGERLETIGEAVVAAGGNSEGGP